MDPGSVSVTRRRWVIWGLPVRCNSSAGALLFELFCSVDPDIRFETVRACNGKSRSGLVWFDVTTSAPSGNPNDLPSLRRKILSPLSPNDQQRHATWNWIIKPHIPYRNRMHRSRTRPACSNPAFPCYKSFSPCLFSWNVQNATTNMNEVADFITRRRPAIFAVQEHRLEVHQWHLDVPGYWTVSKAANPEIPGARGICILGRHDLQAMELPCRDPNIIPLKIFNLFQDRECIFVNLYLPVDNVANRQRRRECWTAFVRLLQTYETKYPSLPIFAGGDFNMKRPELLRKLPPAFLVADNPDNTRFGNQRGGFTATEIDFFIYNQHGTSWVPNHVHTNLEIACSDHCPISIRLKTHIPSPPQHIVPRQKVTIARLAEQQNSIIHDNYWAVLESPEASFSDVSQTILSAHHCIRETSTSEDQPRLHYTLSRTTRRAIKNRNRLAAQLRNNDIRNPACIDTAKTALQHMKSRVKKLVRRDNNKDWNRFVHKGLKTLQHGDSYHAWKWIKSLINKREKPATVQSMQDAEGNLTYDRQKIIELTTQHYKHLAQEPHPKSIEWWSTCAPLPQYPTINELNDAITWTELNMILHRLSTGKSPGMDLLPNEYLRLCRTPIVCTQPNSAMGHALLQECNRIFVGGISDHMNTSILVSIPKPGKDPRLVDNQRGISLISCLLKLVTKIIADRFQTFVLSSAGGLRREQAGFRKLEECPAQVVTLREICSRRKHAGKGTYIAFMDLRKAFDMVPRNALLHVLQSKGVHDTCFNFIKQLYTNGSFLLCSANPTKTIPIQRGVRQGDSLSPVLFDLFIDAALENMLGISVPGLKQTIPGLLLADDAALFAESPEELQHNLDRFGEWATRWHMEIGHDKCGVMVVHDAEAHTQAKQQEWSCQNGFIQVVDQYSYLGTCLDTSLSVKSMIQHRADIGKHALAPLVPLLASAKIPTRIKTMVIKAILIPKICYGAEIWGDSVPTYKPLSHILTEAMIWAVTSSKNKNVVAASILHHELNIPTMKAIIISRRIRAWQKWRHLGTWIAEFVVNKSSSPQDWSYITSRINNSHLQDMVRRGELSPPELRSHNNQLLCSFNPQKLAKLLLRSISTQQSLQCKTYQDKYQRLGLDNTTEYLKASLTTKYTLVYRLLRARLNAHPGLLYRLSTFTALESSQHIDPRNYCVSCEASVQDSIFHLGCHCPHYRTARQELLEPVLYELRSFFEHHHILATDEAQWNACLGGIVSDDPSICAQFRQLWLGPLQKDNKDILVWAQVSAFVSQVLTCHLRKISILVKSRPAMPRVDASPCTTALVIHPTTNRPLSRVLFLFCLFVGLVGLFISFSFILHY